MHDSCDQISNDGLKSRKLGFSFRVVELDLCFYRVKQKKTGTFEKSKKIEEIQEKKFMDRN